MSILRKIQTLRAIKREADILLGDSKEIYLAQQEDYDNTREVFKGIAKAAGLIAIAAAGILVAKYASNAKENNEILKKAFSKLKQNLIRLKRAKQKRQRISNIYKQTTRKKRVEKKVNEIFGRFTKLNELISQKPVKTIIKRKTPEKLAEEASKALRRKEIMNNEYVKKGSALAREARKKKELRKIFPNTEKVVKLSKQRGTSRPPRGVTFTTIKL